MLPLLPGVSTPALWVHADTSSSINYNRGRDVGIPQIVVAPGLVPENEVVPVRGWRAARGTETLQAIRLHMRVVEVFGLSRRSTLAPSQKCHIKGREASTPFIPPETCRTSTAATRLPQPFNANEFVVTRGRCGRTPHKPLLPKASRLCLSHKFSELTS